MLLDFIHHIPKVVFMLSGGLYLLLAAFLMTIDEKTEQVRIMLTCFIIAFLLNVIMITLKTT